MSHRYAIDDEVRLAFGFFDKDAAGTYGIVRLLPSAMDGELQYRIKDKDGRERVIGEGQIAREGQAGQVRRSGDHSPVTATVHRINGAR